MNWFKDTIASFYRKQFKTGKVTKSSSPGTGTTNPIHLPHRCLRVDIPSIQIEVLFMDNQADNFTDVDGAIRCGTLVIFIVAQEATFQNTPLFICL